METLFKIYNQVIYYSWIIFQSPLIITYFIFLHISFFIQKRYFRYNLFPSLLIKKLWNIESIIIRDIFIHLPSSLIDWIQPSLEQKTKEEYMKALTPNAVIRHVCKDDLENTKKNPDEKKNETVFLLKPLSVQQQADLRDNMYKVSGIGKKRTEKFQTGTSEVDALKIGLLGWENFTNEKGDQVSFDKTNVSGMLEMIPADARTELAAKIRGDAEVDEGEG